MPMEPAFITANFVAREVAYKLSPFTWGEADRATQDAFHGPRFAEKFDALCAEVVALGFSNVDIWVAHLNPLRASDGMVDEAIAILAKHKLRVVAYTAGLGRPDVPRADAERIYAVAKRIGAPMLGVWLHPSNARLAYDLGREYGIRYAIENHPEKRPQELFATIGSYGEVIGVAQDIGFWPRFGYDAIQATWDLKDHLFHMHLKQVRQVGEAWDTCAYDDGVNDIPGVLAALKEIGYSGALSIEHEPHDHDPSAEVARSLAMLQGWLG
jgi:sugar phosphate isomerase/epimerase